MGDRREIAREGGEAMSDDVRTLTLTDRERERDTIIAALRLWQRTPFAHKGDLYEIADNERTGVDASLSDEEIDALIEERINV
jgi:hypothetical protein